MPVMALQFIHQCQFSGKIKWYKEESQEGTSIEAKSKKDGCHYSIEFDTNGSIQDIEKKMKLKELPDDHRRTIVRVLNAKFKKWRITRLQEQWKGDQSELLNLVLNGDMKVCELDYEIVIKGKTAERKGFYEMLVSPEGEVLRFSNIVRWSTDNLEF